MAIVIAGHSRCSICKQVIQWGDTTLNIPNMQFGRNDEFFEQNDTGIHQACFETWPLALRFRQRYRDFWLYECGHPRDLFMLEDGSVIDNGRSRSGSE